MGESYSGAALFEGAVRLFSMKVEVEEQVAALFGTTFFLDTPTVARLEKWRAKAPHQAAARAGSMAAPP